MATGWSMTAGRVEAQGKKTRAGKGARGGRKVVGSVEAQAIMTPPEMVGARLVPASPFGGPSKMLDHVLALYGGGPVMWLGTVCLFWRVCRRRKKGPGLLEGGPHRVGSAGTTLLYSGTTGGLLPAPDLLALGLLDAFFGERAELEGRLGLRPLAHALVHELLAGQVAPAAAPRPAM